MVKKDIEKMTYKEQRLTAETIFKAYREAVFQVTHPQYDPYPQSAYLVVREGSMPNHFNVDQRILNHIAKINSCQDYINLVNHALMRLEPNHQLILKKDYADQASANWWQDYFSRSTYYRQKRRAVHDFLQIITG